MKKLKPLFKFFSVFLLAIILLLTNACQLFENDVADFMEKYTETAAIEEYKVNVKTYKDASGQLCIASDEDTEFSLYMRNPKKFSLQPSVAFNQLDAAYSRSTVTIGQQDFATIKLSIPQKFLIPVDEGKNISATINLHEPMSGRDFDRYTVNLSCNTKPPLILNPTILNKGNQTFVLAFDMPNEEEVAIRHKDLAFVEINGVSYPVEVTTSLPDNPDPETPDVRIAHYNFPDPHFKRSYDSSNYIAIGGKTFEHNSNNSVYFESDDAFFAGDKEYKIILRDRAGLTSEVKASTSISKLNKPLIKDQDGYPIAESGIAAVPYDENTERGVITIEPPTADHLGNPVNGTTVYYRVYEATGSGLIYTSGTTMTAKTIELPQNTYRVEAYATLTNYENSATNTVKFRFMNNVLFVRACNSFPNDTDGRNRSGADGSEAAPYTTIQEALADINDQVNRPDKASTFTIMVEGDFTSQTENMQGALGSWGEITLSGDYWTDELIIKKNPRPVNPSGTTKLKSITLEDTLNPNFEVTIGDVTITNADGNGITMESENTLIIDGATITGCDSTGIEASPLSGTGGTVTVKSGTISNCYLGISGEDCNLNVQGGTISENTSSAISYGGTPGVCTISGGTITHNGSGHEAAIYLDAGTCYITGGSIIDNYYRGIQVANSSTLYLYGGSVTNNAICGINVLRGNSIHVKNNPIVKDNTNGSSAVLANIILEAGTTTPAIPDVQITIDGPLTSGARIGVTTPSEPTTIGDTKQFASGYVNSGSPSQFFTSDRGFSIVGGSGGAVSIAKSGSSGGYYLATDYEFAFALSQDTGSTFAFPNQSKQITIALTVERKEPGGGTTTLSYGNLTRYLYAAGTPLNNYSQVDWSIKIMNGGTEAASINGNSKTFTLPALPEGNYKVKVVATYLGQQHYAELDLPINYSVANAVAYINNISSAGEYTVIVEDSVGSSNTTGGLALVANAIYSKLNPNILINLDARGAVNSEDNTHYVYPYFQNCTSLKSIQLPEWIGGLPDSLFEGCSNLTSITIPDSLEVIRANTFENCSSLTTISLPASLEEIGNEAFKGCSGLTEINFAGTKAQWAQVTKGSDWHTNVPAGALVHCAGGETCSLDYILP